MINIKYQLNSIKLGFLNLFHILKILLFNYLYYSTKFASIITRLYNYNFKLKLSLINYKMFKFYI